MKYLKKQTILLGLLIAGFLSANGAVGAKAAKSPVVSQDAVSYDAVAKSAVISYHLNGGSNAANPTEVEKSTTVSLLPATKKGYTFLGWYDNAMFYGSSHTTVSYSDEGVDLYAKWQQDTYTIHYNYAGGKKNLTNPVTTHYADEAKPIYDARRKGYQFDGWFCETTGKMITVIPSNVTNDMFLTARWKKVTVKAAKKASLSRKLGVCLKLTGKTVKGAEGYEFQYWAKNGKKYKVEASKAAFLVTRWKQKAAYRMRYRAFCYDSTGAKVYGEYSATAKLKAIKTAKKKAAKK